MSNAVAINPFDPIVPGHPESLWSKMLFGVQPWAPAAGSLVVVSPHPDDEVLGAGGLIHAWAGLGHPVTVVSVTDGEAAYPNVHELGNLRTRELKCALRKLSTTHVSIVRLALPDGHVQRVRNRLRNALSSLLTPGTTIVAPYERDGHPDHDAIGEVCLSVSGNLRLPLVRYPIWRWRHGNPKDLQNVRWGKFSLSLEARRAKGRAVECFASQLVPTHGAPIVPSHVLHYFERPFEAFIL